jgi:hypothetical protein
MKQAGIISAAIATGGLLLGGALPGNAAATSYDVSTHTSAVKFVKRDFDCWSHVGCLASAKLPSTWKHVKLAPSQARFTDRTSDRMIRFDMAYGARSDISTVTAVKRKQAALKGTRGLKVLGTSTATMKSSTGQGPLTVSTIVYTYRSGKTTRWVATRYVGTWGYKNAGFEITVAGAPKDKKFLGTVINTATQSLDAR